MGELITILLPIVGVWGALGVGAKALGITKTVGEGMKAVGKGVVEELGIATTQQNNVLCEVDEEQLKALTEQIKQFFEYLVYESACFNADLLKIVYLRGQLNVGIDVVEAVFRNFIRQINNLPANAPLFTWLYMDDSRLYLFAAFSDTGRTWIQQQRNNQRSRQILGDRDLVE